MLYEVITIARTMRVPAMILREGLLYIDQGELRLEILNEQRIIQRLTTADVDHAGGSFFQRRERRADRNNFV